MLGGAYPVRVIVDEPGYYCAAFEIDHPGIGYCQFAYFRIAARRNHALTFDRQRLRDGEAIINRDDLAVD